MGISLSCPAQVQAPRLCGSVDAANGRVRLFPPGPDAEPRSFGGVVRAVSCDGARFWYDVDPGDHAAHALLGSAGAAIFKTGVDHTSGIRNEGGVVSLVGLRVRPRPSPPPEVGALKPPASDDDNDDDEASLRRRADRWATPPGAWGRFTHEAASVSGFLRALDAEGRRRERDRPRRKRPRPAKTSNLSISVTSKSLRLMFGRIVFSRRCLFTVKKTCHNRANT